MAQLITWGGLYTRARRNKSRATSTVLWRHLRLNIGCGSRYAAKLSGHDIDQS
jgi:hypothetical protein